MNEEKLAGNNLLAGIKLTAEVLRFSSLW